jgi:hypothetical protein
MYNKEDGTPYYIGKGPGNRALYKGKYEIHPPKDKNNIIFIKEGMVFDAHNVKQRTL